MQRTLIATLLLLTPALALSGDRAIPMHPKCSHYPLAARSIPQNVSVYDTTMAHPFDVLHMGIVLDLNRPEAVFDAEVTFQLRITENATDRIRLHLRDSRLDSVLQEGLRLGIEAQTEDGFEVQLPSALSAGDNTEFTVFYQGTLFSYDDQLGGLIDKSLSRTFDGNVLYTYAEPNGTRRWLACFDHPAEKVTTQMEVIHDSTLSTLSNGYFIGRFSEGGRRVRTVWRSDNPISTYLISLNIADYTIVEDRDAGVNQVPVEYWLPDPRKEEYGWAMATMHETPEMIEFYEGLFTPYPFVKYFQALAPMASGGMEHQSATTIGESYISADGQYDYIVAHELGHHWFGNVIGPETFKDAWLNEGFTTYLDALWQAGDSDIGINTVMHEYQEAAKSYIGLNERVYNPPQYTPGDHPRVLFSGLIYYKGAAVVHLMRRLVGDEVFFPMIREWINRNAYGSVNTARLQAILEEFTGDSWQTFFDEWVYRGGYPDYTPHDFAAYADGQGTYTAELGLTQTEWRGLYSTPVPIQIVYTDETDTLFWCPVEATVEQTLFMTDLPKMPWRIRFDKDSWVLSTVSARHFLLGVGEEPEVGPRHFALSNAWPNPFNSQVRMALKLNRETRDVRLVVTNLLGQSVARMQWPALSPGEHQLGWTPEGSLASGIYLIRVSSAAGDVVTRRVTLVR